MKHGIQLLYSLIWKHQVASVLKYDHSVGIILFLEYICSFRFQNNSEYQPYHELSFEFNVNFDLIS